MRIGELSAVVKLLSMPVAIGLLTACGQQPAPAKAEKPVKTAQSEIDEVHALVAGIKQHPSMVNAKDAGPPIHVDPFPKSSGMASHHHMGK